ncbi:MAG TPA: pepsin/retropepsin-like aspartic protease family protein, partial [Candidatus Krumholzibacteria bacterium]|nr:pepsin/retropepsin-like aspartic protease family protein [Candidatus Krumholzibacteria bacterium]
MKTPNQARGGLFTAVAALTIAGPAQGVGQTISDSEALARVPMTFTRNQVRIPVSVNGSEPFTLILDTGMPTRGLLLRAGERVDALGLEFLGTDSVSGGGSDGALSARVSKGQRIELGGLAIPEVPVIVLPEQNLMQDVDGVIGAELFERFAVRVDADRLRVELIDPGIFQPAHGSSIVPLRFNQGVAFVDAEVTVDAGAPVAADLALDLGAGHALWLNEKSNPRLASPAGAIETVLGRGLSGEIRGSIGRVHRLQLGDFAFENVVTLFPVGEHQNPGGFDFRDGFIGAEILTRFVVTYDYAQKRMVLERGGMF